MSGDPSLILETISSGTGICLDLGGNSGALQLPVEKRGYRYLNLDIRDFGNAQPSIIGDAHRLPFKDRGLDVVISKDSLEHFTDPWTVVNEIHRVLKKGGKLIIWVPFMHPFHGDDYYRYSPLGLKHLLKDFEIVHFDSPLWVFTVCGLAAVEMFKRIRLGYVERPIKRLCALLDSFFMIKGRPPASFAAGYRIIAHKPSSVEL